MTELSLGLSIYLIIASVGLGLLLVLGIIKVIYWIVDAVYESKQEKEEIKNLLKKLGDKKHD